MKIVNQKHRESKNRFKEVSTPNFHLSGFILGSTQNEDEIIKHELENQKNKIVLKLEKVESSML